MARTKQPAMGSPGPWHMSIDEIAAVHKKITLWEAGADGDKPLHEVLGMKDMAEVKAWEAAHRPPKPKREKPKSRAVRWADAVADAREAKEKIEAAVEDWQNAMSALNDLKSEYEEWRDNLPESFQSTALGEKLEAVCDLDFEQELDLGPLEVIDEADGIDLPQGFGRD